jgi:fructose-bisphosphate aldolase class II
MALVSFVGALREAQREKRTIPLFVNLDMVTTQAIIQACEETGKPAFFGLWAGVLDRPGGPEFAKWVRAVGEASSATLSLMMDHGRTFEDCKLAVDLGYSDVMIDGSKLPLDENVELASRVAEVAHGAGVGVEAELGIVGSGRDYESFGGKGEGLTDPDQAASFAEQTGCDILAVAIGTAHGEYKGKPEVDLERLSRLRAATDVPLAVHGGSGLTDEQFLLLREGGVCKVNIGTDLRLAARDAMAEIAGKSETRYFHLLRAAQKAAAERAVHYLNLLG